MEDISVHTSAQTRCVSAARQLTARPCVPVLLPHVTLKRSCAVLQANLAQLGMLQHGTLPACGCANKAGSSTGLVFIVAYFAFVASALRERSQGAALRIGRFPGNLTLVTRCVASALVIAKARPKACARHIWSLNILVWARTSSKLHWRTAAASRFRCTSESRIMQSRTMTARAPVARAMHTSMRSGALWHLFAC